MSNIIRSWTVKVIFEFVKNRGNMLAYNLKKSKYVVKLKVLIFAPDFMTVRIFIQR